MGGVYIGITRKNYLKIGGDILRGQIGKTRVETRQKFWENVAEGRSLESDGFVRVTGRGAERLKSGLAVGKQVRTVESTVYRAA